MPAEPPVSHQTVGQSSFVDFGENDRDLAFAVIFDKPSVFVCDCDRVTDRSLLNLALACTVRIWSVIGLTQNVKNQKHRKSVCKHTQDA